MQNRFKRRPTLPLIVALLLLSFESCFRPPTTNDRSFSENRTDTGDSLNRQSEANQQETCDAPVGSLNLTTPCRINEEGEGVPGYLTEDLTKITTSVAGSTLVFSGMAGAVLANENADVVGVNLVFMQMSKKTLNTALASNSLQPVIVGEILAATRPNPDGSFRLGVPIPSGEILLIRAGGKPDNDKVSVPQKDGTGKFAAAYSDNSPGSTFLAIASGSIPQSGPASDTYWIFVSSSFHSGDFSESGRFSGVAGLDHHCRNIAATPGNIAPSGLEWKAIAGDDSQSHMQHVALPNGPLTIKLVNGSLVATNASDFWDNQSFAHPRSRIHISQTGSEVSPSSAWTGSGTEGGDTENCDNWTTASSIKRGGIGSTDGIGALWHRDGVGACSGNYHVYCIGH